MIHPGHVSNIAKKMLTKICKFYCKEAHIRVILKFTKFPNFLFQGRNTQGVKTGQYTFSDKKAPPDPTHEYKPPKVYV